MCGARRRWVGVSTTIRIYHLVVNWYDDKNVVVDRDSSMFTHIWPTYSLLWVIFLRHIYGPRYSVIFASIFLAIWQITEQIERDVRDTVNPTGICAYEVMYYSKVVYPWGLLQYQGLLTAAHYCFILFTLYYCFILFTLMFEHSCVRGNTISL